MPTRDDTPLSVIPDNRNFVYVPENNAEQLMLHLEKYPITIVMYSCDPFQFKNFGIGVFMNTT